MRLVAVALHLCALALLTFAIGCADSNPISPPGGGSGGGGGAGDEPSICLMNNCTADEHCGSCPDGLNTCLVSENRCVACDRTTGEGCPEGMECTPYGKCAPAGSTCPTDGHGTPTITCQSDIDCAACDPQHNVCDPATSRCVACTPANTLACQSTDTCVDGQCMANCPDSCDTDADCNNCGSVGKTAHACQAHKCAECSDTVPCPAGQVCSPQGRCQLLCGNDNTGTCDTDADCGGCENGQKCHKPINGGVGTCGPQANGCSDIGQSVAVLPSPWDQVTNLCSNDGDCAGVGITLNVGKILRDLTGINEINDANINYGMNSCASVNVSNTSCGVCVPCKVDSDCEPIDIDQVAADAFGPLGSLAAAFLLDQVFGNKPHKIHLYCDQVAGGYGVCLPCPNWFSSCGVGGFNGGGGCDHDVCQVGGPLNTSCSSCAQTVCNFDSYCCSNQWDNQCVAEAAQLCNAGCSGSSQCAHDECATGGKLTPTCSSCAQAVCNADPFCCNNQWDALCVQHVGQYCSGKSCGGSGSSCAHDECATGDKLSPNCSSCASIVCNVDSYCCSTAWDGQCVNEAAQYCNKCGGGGSGGCAHDVCVEGGSLNPSCSACANAVCSADPFCCNNSWDSQCVGQAEYYCNKNCGGGSSLSCAHDECVAGGKLQNGCSSCVSTVCGADPYCCSTEWDSQCVSQAESWCGKSCGGGGSSCSHSECASGQPLSPNCSSCAAAVCAYDAYCCTTAWDWTCVDEVNQFCSISCI